jgi:hypothetical protein
MSELSAGLLDDAWESASWAGDGGVNGNVDATGDAVLLLASLREAHAEAESLRTALADGGLDLLETRGAYAKTITSLRNEIAARTEEALRCKFAHEAELDVARTRIVELGMRLETATNTPSLYGAIPPTGHSECDRVLALALASEVTARAGESAATEDCAVLADALRARAGDAVAARAEADAATTRARALAEQLAQVVMSGAGDAVRADEAETARITAERALAKREAQLLRVVEALKAVRERETLASTALDAQAASLAVATEAASVAIEESARWRALATERAAETETAWQDAASARAQAAQLEAARSMSAEALANAEAAADAVRVLSTALALAQEEKERLVAALSDSRSERARADASAARRTADTDALVAGLAADLAAANAALATAAGTSAGLDFGRTGSRGGNNNNKNNRKTNMVQPTRIQVAAGGRVGAQSAVSGLSSGGGGGGGGGGVGGGTGDASDAKSVEELGRQIESLSRALVRARERAAAVESEAEELLDVNERLRVTLETVRDEPATDVTSLDSALQLAAELSDRGKRLKGTATLQSEDINFKGGGGGGGGGTRNKIESNGVGGSVGTTTISAALVAHAIECETAFAATRALVAAAQALAAGVRAQLESATDTLDDDGGGGGGGNVVSDSSVRNTRAGGSSSLGMAAGAVGDAIDAASAMARAQAMTANMPTREVLLAALGSAAADTGNLLPRGEALIALGLSNTLTRAPLLARLVDAAARAVEAVLADMRAKAADNLGEVCAMQ